MSSPWDFFDAVRCINLSHREDRWRAVQDEFRAAGVLHKVRRFRATTPRYHEHQFKRIGEQGCLDSHTSVIREAQARGAANCLIFEDDVKFFNVDVNYLLASACTALPEKWDLFYLGCSEWRGIYYSYRNSLVRVTNAATAHAVAVNGSFFSEALSLLEQARHRGFAVDKVWECIVQPNMNCYMSKPMICYHGDGYSDIMKAHVKPF